MKELRVIVTGGTIDKVHDPASEGLSFSPDGATHLPEMLRIGRCHFPVVEKLMLKICFISTMRIGPPSRRRCVPHPSLQLC